MGPEASLQEPFRVSVCLKAFFGDERARCLVSARRGARVRWLLRRLRRLFPSLPRAICLLNEGHLLPPNEPLALLPPGAAVRLIPTQNKYDWQTTDDDHSEVEVGENGSIKSGRSDDAFRAEDEVDNRRGDGGRAAEPSTDDDLLREAKQRALASLSMFNGGQRAQEGAGEPARRPRRRVRRRRAPPARAASRAPSPAAALVLRNPRSEARPPRMVRSLSPRPTPCDD